MGDCRGDYTRPPSQPQGDISHWRPHSFPSPAVYPEQLPWRPYERQMERARREGGTDGEVRKWGGRQEDNGRGRIREAGDREDTRDFPDRAISGPHHLHRALLSLPTNSLPCLPEQISPLSQAFLLLRTLPPRASPQDWVLFLDERSFILSEWLHLGKESSPPADTQGSPPPPHHQVEHPRATQPHFVINHHYRWSHPKQTLPELPTPGATQNKPYLSSIHSMAKTHRGC